MGKMPELGAMLRCEERGDYSTMRGHLRSFSDDILEKAGPEEVRKFAELLLRVIKAIDHEAANGPGSLMKWDHPYNQELLQMGAFAKRYPSQQIRQTS